MRSERHNAQSPPTQPHARVCEAESSSTLGSPPARTDPVRFSYLFQSATKPVKGDFSMGLLTRFPRFPKTNRQVHHFVTLRTPASLNSGLPSNRAFPHLDLRWVLPYSFSGKVDIFVKLLSLLVEPLCEVRCHRAHVTRVVRPQPSLTSNFPPHRCQLP